MAIDPAVRRPRLTAARVEPGAAAIRPPECLDQRILGRRPLANNAQDPPIDLVLVLPEDSLEGVAVAMHEPREQIAVDVIRHQCL